MSKTPVVSVIMPTYFSADFVRHTVDSVQKQSFKEWELVMVDDASTDGTVEILKELANSDPRIRVFFNEKNSGPAFTRNRAIQEARGRYIAFLDSDDEWLTNKLELQLKFMASGPYPLSYHSYEIYDESLKNKLSEFKVQGSVSHADILRQCPISCCAAMYDTQMIGKRFMPNIIKRQDYGLFLDILRDGHRAYAMPEILLKVRIRSGSVSSNKWVAAQYQWRIYRGLEKMSLATASYHFVNYGFLGVRKYLPVFLKKMGLRS